MESDFVYATTRTGKKIHAMHPGSSVTSCGHWQKAGSQYFQVKPESVQRERLCERCFSPGHNPAEHQAPEPEQGEDMTYLADLSLEELRQERSRLRFGSELFHAAKRIIEGREIPRHDRPLLESFDSTGQRRSAWS